MSTKTKMHPTQNAYAVALALHQTLKIERDELTKEWQAEHGKLERGSDERHVEGYYEYLGQVETELGYWPALDALTMAENNMIEWAIGKVIHVANEKDAAGILDMVEKAKTFGISPKARQNLVDISFRLNAR